MVLSSVTVINPRSDQPSASGFDDLDSLFQRRTHAEIVMQNIEEQALASYKRTIPLWSRYIDDTFTTLHKEEIDDFQEHLNRQNVHIQLTKEIEDNNKIPFLDCFVIRDNNDGLQKTHPH